MVIREEWGLPHTSVEYYLLGLPSLIRNENGVFYFSEAQITVEKLPLRQFGGVGLERTLVVFEGKESPLSELYRAFQSQFLSLED